MPLTFDLTAVDNEKYPFIVTGTDADGAEVGHHNPITEAVIWMSLVTGSPSRQKSEDFVRRALIWDRVAGPMIHDWDEEKQERKPHPLTAEELFDHAGVSTNATVLTAAEFKKRVMQSLEDDAGWDIKRFQREQAKADA